MSMETISQLSLTYLSTYGIPALLVITFIGSLGIPFPVTLIVVGAGAFTRSGLLSPGMALMACLLGAALADNSQFLLGRKANNWLARRLGNQAAWQQARAVMQRQGGMAVFLTRFWLTPLASAVNLTASGHLPYARFLAFDLLGELVWVLIYGSVGYFFVAEWEQASQALSQFSGLSVLAVGLALAAYLLTQRRRSGARAALAVEAALYTKN